MMTLKSVALLLISFSTLTLAARIHAGEATLADPDLPQPFDAKAASSLLESSPFTRPLNLSESLQLTGIAYVEGKPVATLVDRATNKRYLVSDTPNDMGWRLKEASPSSELKYTEVKLIVGSEEVSIHYNNAQLDPPKKGYGPSKQPSEQEAIRNDENGKPYVKGSVYLSDADRERYMKSLSPEGHEKFRQIIRDNREKMFSSSPADRAAFAKQALEKAFTEGKAK